MDEEAKSRALEWVKAWKRAGTSLERIHREELKSFDYEAAKPLLHSLLTWAVEHAEIRETTGLQEQQTWFKKLRKK